MKTNDKHRSRQSKSKQKLKVNILKGPDLTEISFDDGGGRRDILCDRDLFSYEEVLKKAIEMYFKGTSFYFIY